MARSILGFGDAATFSFLPPNLSSPNFVPVTAPTKLTDTGDVLANINKAIDTYYGTKLNIAQQQAAVRVAKAQGHNAEVTAQSGLPSPTLLTFMGLGLAAILLFKK